MNLESDLKYIIKNLGEKDISKFKNKTVLLTGSGGFLGRWFVQVFDYLNQEYLNNTLTLICLESHIVNDNNITHKSIKLDITKSLSEDLEKNKIKNIDYILNCAGIASPEKYQKFPIETLDVSYLGTKNILDLSFKYKVESIMLFSSSEVYGTPRKDAIPTKETYIGSIPTTSNRSCYDIGKQVLETLGYVYFNKFKTPIKTVRPFNIYGPFMDVNDKRVLPNFVKSFIKNEPIKIYGDGKQTRTFCYIADSIVMFLKILLNGENGECYNIGNPNPEISMIKLAKLFYKSLGSKNYAELIPYPNAYPSDEPLRRCPDISKTIKITKFKPQIKLEDGIKKMFDYIKLSS